MRQLLSLLLELIRRLYPEEDPVVRRGQMMYQMMYQEVAGLPTVSLALGTAAGWLAAGSWSVRMVACV